MSEFNLPNISEKRSLNKIFSAENFKFNKFIKNDIRIDQSRFEDFIFQKKILKEKSENSKRSCANINKPSELEDPISIQKRNEKIKTMKELQQIHSKIFPVKIGQNFSEKNLLKSKKVIIIYVEQ
jgi:hypothetical protein